MQYAIGMTLADVEREVIREVMKYHQGNITHTAKTLGVSIKTIRSRVKEYREAGIEIKDDGACDTKPSK